MVGEGEVRGGELADVLAGSGVGEDVGSERGASNSGERGQWHASLMGLRGL